jgi:thioredoxin 1
MSKLINNEQELDQVLKSKKGVMVLFYASWCPFSRAFLPVFEKQAEGKEDSFCRVATDNMAKCEDDYAIEVVPTVLFFENGQVVKRLDGISGVGLNEKQLKEMINYCKLK